MQGLSDETISKSIGISLTTFLPRIRTTKKQLNESTGIFSVKAKEMNDYGYHSGNSSFYNYCYPAMY